MQSEVKNWHGTTIIGVLKNGSVSIAGDGQVTLGQTVIKGTAKKVQRKLFNSWKKIISALVKQRSD